MSVPDRLGKAYSLYLKASVPTDAQDSSEYDEVLYLSDIQVQHQRAEHDVSTRNSPGGGFWAEFLAGRISGSINITGIYDVVQETGQQHVKDAMLGESQSAAKKWFLYTSDVSGDEEIYGTVIVTNLQRGAPDEGPFPFSATLRVTGKSTEAVIA